MAKVVIIGAGLTGLSTAYHLEEQGFFDYKIFEKESIIGGLCRSIEQDGFTFDFTGHLLHCNDPYFKSFIEKLIGKNHFNHIVRKSFIYSHDVHTYYPYQTHLYGLPEKIITDCIEGFVSKDTTIKHPITYYDWVLSTFGSGFGKHFFFPYQQKIFAYDLKKLTASWTGRFVPSTSLTQIIRGAISKESEKNIGYNATFLYPKKGGIVSWLKKLSNQLINPIKTNFCAKKIDLKNKTVIFSNGHTEPFQILISTMPLDLLLKNIQETSTMHIKQAHRNLICNSVVNFNLGINKKNVTKKNWIYYPEKKFPFYRIGFPHTFSTAMTPKNCSSLYGEIAHIGKPTKTIDSILQNAITKTMELLDINQQEIVTKNILHIPHAYVIYDFWREKNIEAIHQQLHHHAIYSIGRYGEWKYASMQESVLDGKIMAETIMSLKTTPIFSISKSRKIISQKKQQTKGA